MSKRFIAAIAVVAVATTVIYLYFSFGRTNARRVQVFNWFRDPSSNSDMMLRAGSRCGEVPFLFPTDGVAGFLWDDSFRAGHRHQGIDIFGGTDPGVTKVIAAYPGYLRRLPDWKSSVIMRVPEDPLVPGRQIWLYYTHMADKNGESYISYEFPPGSTEKWIEAGTFLGYQGNYSGDPFNPVGVHLHFSIVKDDGTGRFKNELEIDNTYDPSPYLGLALNANKNQNEIPLCE
ncbi:MAG: hypothetical protein A2Y54_03490 [Chloroflexi bacterium RBG_16_51_16]|nr:MAG: hypothetical protein A2Y54_03490 [Chloroflexi bacterium RBG_16_51_16]